MDLGLAGSTAVVTGGSKGMGLAMAHTLATEGASVAVMARGRPALDAAVESLLGAGAPDAVGISVDMTDATSIARGFDEVSDRWGRLNSLVHTIGPGDGDFEQMDDAEWDAAFTLGTMAGVRSIRAALPMLRAADWARIVTLSAHSIPRQHPRLVAHTASTAAPPRGWGPHRHLVRAFHPAAEPAHRRLHGVESGPVQRHQKPVEKPCQGRNFGELRVPGDHRDRALHREPQGHPRRRRPRCIRPARCHDLDQ